MNLRRVVLDVDMSVKRPSLVDLAQAISQCAGVEAVNLTVEEIDIEIVGMDVTIEGNHLDYEALIKAIESTGAVVHSLDQLVAGDRLIERVPRVR